MSLNKNGTRVIIIDNCSLCPYQMDTEIGQACRRMKRLLEREWDMIPEVDVMPWCPLKKIEKWTEAEGEDNAEGDGTEAEGRGSEEVSREQGQAGSLCLWNTSEDGLDA